MHDVIAAQENIKAKTLATYTTGLSKPIRIIRQWPRTLNDCQSLVLEKKPSEHTYRSYPSRRTKLKLKDTTRAHKRVSYWYMHHNKHIPCCDASSSPLDSSPEKALSSFASHLRFVAIRQQLILPASPTIKPRKSK